jgi:hypothetical protein
MSKPACLTVTATACVSTRYAKYERSSEHSCEECGRIPRGRRVTCEHCGTPESQIERTYWRCDAEWHHARYECLCQTAVEYMQAQMIKGTARAAKVWAAHMRGYFCSEKCHRVHAIRTIQSLPQLEDTRVWLANGKQQLGQLEREVRKRLLSSLPTARKSRNGVSDPRRISAT